MKNFGWSRPVRDRGGLVIGSKPSPVKVRTIATLGHAFGSDHNKRLILTAHPLDLIGLRPERTAREVIITARDLYRYVLQCHANRANLQRARARKAAKTARLAARRLKAAEKRLTR